MKMIEYQTWRRLPAQISRLGAPLFTNHYMKGKEHVL